MSRWTAGWSCAAVFLAGCAASVTHPTKSVAEMQVDIDGCTRSANDKYWMDPVAALYSAYDCLEEMGYRRGRKDFAGRVERALGEERRVRQDASKPCAVPCG
jgi:hypothetical protein